MPDQLTAIQKSLERPDCELLPGEGIIAVRIALAVCHNLQVPLSVCQLDVMGKVLHMLADMWLS
jgi:hypothetical protein